MSPIEALNTLVQAAALAPMPLSAHQQVHAAVQSLHGVIQRDAEATQKREARKQKSKTP